MFLNPSARLSLLLVLFCSLTAGAQQPVRNDAPSLTYGFVSPNTREGLKLEDAIEGLSSAEETRLITRAKRLSCIARSPVQVVKAVGSWSDGAEHSVVIRTYSDLSTVRYIVAWLGKDNSQKAVLYFRTDPGGTAVIYRLRPQRRSTLRILGQLLDRNGITFRTIVPQKRSVLVYVVDLKRELRAKITTAARNLKARLSSSRGSAEFIGDDSSREKASAIFNEEIQNYESKNLSIVTRCQRALSKTR